jgi:hypothetical protein
MDGLFPGQTFLKPRRFAANCYAVGARRVAQDDVSVLKQNLRALPSATVMDFAHKNEYFYKVFFTIFFRQFLI